ncbi:MAG: hypothetical protein KDD64_04065, partial [Bdellovibrionales bacterium]|nr:hypothetical protein [Bdellovibrionales bacterium]
MTFHPDENRSPSSSPSAEGGARLSGREQTATPAELREALLKIDEHNSPLLALDRKSGGLKEKLISYAQKALECLEKLCHLATNFEDALAKPDTSAEDLKKIQERSAEALKELSDQIKEIPRVERERYRYDPTIGKFIERTSEAISDASAKLDTDLPPEILHRARIEDMARVRKLAKDFLESHRLEERRAESDETINGLIDAIEKATANPPRVDFAPFNEAVQIAKAQDAARSGSRGVNQRFVSECLKNFKEQLDQADPELAINVSRFSHLIRECRREILAAAINADRAEAPTQSLSREKAEEAVEILKQGKIREGFNLALADHPQDAVLGFNVSHHPETGELRVGRPITKSAIQRNKNEVLKSFAYSKALLADEQFDDRSRELLDGWLGTGNDSIEHQIKLMREKADGLQTVDNELGGILLYSCTRMSRGLKELRDAYEKRKQEALAQPVAEPSKVPVENKTEQSVPDSSTQVTTEPSPASTPERIVSHFETQVTSKVTELLDGIDVSDRHSDFVSDFGRLAREVEKSEDRDGAREFVEYAVRELREVLPAERQAEAGVLLNNFRQKLGLPTINERSNSAPGEGAPQAEYRPATSVGDDSGDARQDVEAQENGAKDASPSVPATAAAGVEAPLETSAVDTKVPGAVDPVVVGVEGSSPDAAQERTYRFQHEFADELLRHALGETATPRSPEIKSELLFRVDRAPGAKGKGQKIHRERFEEWVAKAREEIQKSTPPKQHARRLAALDEFVEQVKPAIYEGKAVAISPLGRLRMEAVSLRLRAQDTVQASFQRKEGRLPPEARSSELALSASVIRVCRAMERSSEIGKADAKALFDGAQDRLIAMVEAIPQTQRGDQGVRIGRRLDRLERAYDQWFEANQKRAEEIRAQRAADRQQGPASQTSVESVAEAGAVNPGDSGEVGAPEATSPQGPAGEIEVDRGATGDERNPEDSAQVGAAGTFPEDPETATTEASGADSSGVSPDSSSDLSARSNFERFVEFRRVGTELRVRLTSPFDENSKVVFRVNPAAEERLRQELQVLSNGESDLC